MHKWLILLTKIISQNGVQVRFDLVEWYCKLVKGIDYAEI